MRYRLLAIDLDGTLLGPDQTVSAANVAAIAQAVEAGVLVVPCTGRGWAESTPYLGGVAGFEVGVFNTGAAVAEIATGKAVDLATFEPHLALELIEFLRPIPEAVIAYMDRDLAGVDYLVTGDGQLTDNTRRWFELNGLKFRRDPHPTADDLHHCLRVGLVAHGHRAFEVEAEVLEHFPGRISVHAFAGVPTAKAQERIFITEIFAAGVNKWRGIKILADQRGIDPAEVATIGDEVNDLAMLEQAGLGIAMANAVHAAKDAANRCTRSNTEDGVAHAIRQMLAGRW